MHSGERPSFSVEHERGFLRRRASLRSELAWTLRSGYFGDHLLKFHFLSNLFSTSQFNRKEKGLYFLLSKKKFQELAFYLVARP